MPAYVYVTAGLVAGAIVVLVTNLLALRTSTAGSQSNLTRGTSARQMALQTSARTRLLRPLYTGIAERARALTSKGQLRR